MEGMHAYVTCRKACMRMINTLLRIVERREENSTGKGYSYFPRAAVTNYHKVGGLKQHKVYSRISSRGQKSESKGLWGENPPCHPQFVVASDTSWLVAK